MGNGLGADFEPDNIDTTLMDGKYLTFDCCGQSYGFPVRDVMLILDSDELTEVPAYPLYARGVINVRQAVIPVIDFRMLTGHGQYDVSGTVCVVIVKMNESYVGIIVDDVEEVLDIPADMISLPPCADKGYMTGVGRTEGRLSLLLDPCRMLSAGELAKLA